MPRGYEEGPVAEEAQARIDALERGEPLEAEGAPPDRAAVFGSTDDDAEPHFLRAIVSRNEKGYSARLTRSQSSASLSSLASANALLVVPPEKKSYSAGSAMSALPLRDYPFAFPKPKEQRRTLDVYTTTESKNQPIVFWIHGGG